MARIGTLYRIVVGQQYYIGSTMQEPAEKRWWDHKSNAKNTKCHMHNYAVYVKMREFGIENCQFEIIRQFEIMSKIEATKEENIEMAKYTDEQLLNVRNAFLSRANRKKRERQRAKRQRESEKAKDPEGFLKKEREKQKAQRLKQKAKNPELFIQRQRDYNQGLRIPEIKVEDPLEHELSQRQYLLNNKKLI